MKARMTFWKGYWWCRRMGFTGQGLTMEAAYNDMWNLYWEAMRPKAPLKFCTLRARA